MRTNIIVVLLSVLVGVLLMSERAAQYPIEFAMGYVGLVAWSVMCHIAGVADGERKEQRRAFTYRIINGVKTRDHGDAE